MDCMAREEKPHAVCIAFPAQGHINAMLQLAKLLHIRGFYITFVLTEQNFNRILATCGPSSLEGLPEFRIETISDGLKSSDPASGQEIHTLGSVVRNNLSEPFRQLLKRLNESDGPKVSCVVSDTFTSLTLWPVIRPNIVAGDSAILPKEFLSEISERDLLTSWCPQEEVLMHPSIGVFLTHNGWNSTMESIGSGIPMICWPYFGDQQTNCWYVCNEWGIGLQIIDDIKREEVERLIRDLMEGEKGNEIRRMALKWKESAIAATKPDGKSSLNLERVIKEVLLQKVKCI